MAKAKKLNPIRQAVIDAMKSRSWSSYRLAMESGNERNKTRIKNFTNPEIEMANVEIETLSKVFRALNLKIVAE